MKVGTIGWLDLTVENADQLRDFYRDVVGWAVGEVPMEGYSDYTMGEPDEGQPVAGVCHARGPNQQLPAVWLPYIIVADLDRSLEACHRLGGHVVGEVRSNGNSRFCIIRDPAGAHLALYQP